MPTTTAPVATPTIGVITLDGQQYIEHVQIFPYEVTISRPGQVITQLRLTLPGVANFLLKGLTRYVMRPGELVSQERHFRFRMLNMEGSTWYFSSGLGIFDDRVVDSLIFGNAQFPFPLIPPIPVSANGSLFLEVEDMGLTTGIAGYTPYTIYFAFHGSYIIPIDEPAATHGKTNGGH